MKTLFVKIFLLFSVCLNAQVTKEYVYEHQGNGKDSWKVTEKDSLGAVVNVYMIYERPEGYAATKEEAVEIKSNQINKRSEELTALGFVFDGRKWPMSDNARENWSNFKSIPDIMFPLPMLDADLNEYSLTLAKRDQFYLAALRCKYGNIQSGNNLIKQVKILAQQQGTTIQDILNFQDPR